MYKSGLAQRLARRTGPRRAVARNAVGGLFETIDAALVNGQEIRVSSFGTFGTRFRPVRTGRNPAHGRAGRDRGPCRAGLQGRKEVVSV